MLALRRDKRRGAGRDALSPGAASAARPDASAGARQCGTHPWRRRRRLRHRRPLPEPQAARPRLFRKARRAGAAHACRPWLSRAAWLAHHRADFAWLRQKTKAGALDIAWANHSFSHPYVRRLPDGRNYFLRPGVDVDREIFETEKLIIAEGETPSAFFRFPGLVADAALLERIRSRHLIALGADSWLALGLRPRPGAIVLVHPNGNEPVGLRLFSRLIDAGAMPLPLRPINEAP